MALEDKNKDRAKLAELQRGTFRLRRSRMETIENLEHLFQNYPMLMDMYYVSRHNVQSMV